MPSPLEPVPPDRSRLMSRVKSRNTQPEMIIRRLVNSMGYRFRLHRHSLPGSPDLVFPRRKRVLFVHGCFWHRHPGCRHTTTPKTRVDFWQAKFQDNIARDLRVESALRESGWEVLVVWACEIKDIPELRGRLEEFLG
ncbi:very short patch repair endonuclease [Mesorhizobium sp. AR07]|uniref:very short patch repair endonuclease n=1 Tax=Mesorhizobium sp. AR07 TaxID=2865838 RepID=UPI00215ED400|nr:very short patch repair endonuclease [Mesorhizobium sp. AR07]UVK42692.1 very short patch repair endonuclease [Mesorhizobium sp. AR07]